MLGDRLLEAEVMDQPGLDPDLHRQALAGLGRVNWFSRTAQVLGNAMFSIARRQKLRELRVLDLASGGGDVSVRMATAARKRGLILTIHGWDKSATAVSRARALAASKNVSTIEYFQHDALLDPIAGEYDVVLSTLFLHHLTQPQAELLLRRMADAARYAVLIDDLLRTDLGYWLAWAGCRLLSRSPVVRADGPMSVKAAFREEEIRQLAGRAGLHGATIDRHWPQRFLLTWMRP